MDSNILAANNESLDTLTADYVNDLPVLSYRGPITMVESPQDLDVVCTYLSKQGSIGFDTESRPSFVKGQVYPISLIQFATLDHVFIVYYKLTGFTKSLKDLLESKVEKIGVGLKDDIRKLGEDCDFTPGSMIDLSVIARSKGYRRSSLRILSAWYLKHRIVKTAQKTNWARTNLTESQLRYAATDAWACLLIRPLLDSDPRKKKIKST